MKKGIFIVQFQRDSKTLKYLSVASNALRDDTVMDIKESLMENEYLIKLNFENTEITDFGVSELASVLKVNKTIEVFVFMYYKKRLLKTDECLSKNLFFLNFFRISLSFIILFLLYYEGKSS